MAACIFSTDSAIFWMIAHSSLSYPQKYTPPFMACCVHSGQDHAAAKNLPVFSSPPKRTKDGSEPCNSLWPQETVFIATLTPLIAVSFSIMPFASIPKIMFSVSIFILSFSAACQGARGRAGLAPTHIDTDRHDP